MTNNTVLGVIQSVSVVTPQSHVTSIHPLLHRSTSSHIPTMRSVQTTGNPDLAALAPPPASLMSWPAFNRLWMDICNILNSPSYNVLLVGHCSHEPEYLAKPADLTREILASGVFGPLTQGRSWHGRHEPERDGDA